MVEMSLLSKGKWPEEDCGRERQDPPGLQPLLWPDYCQWQPGQGLWQAAGGCGTIAHGAAVGSRQLGLLTHYLQTDRGAEWPRIKSRHPKGRRVRCRTSMPSRLSDVNPVWIWVLHENCVTLLWTVRFLSSTLCNSPHTGSVLIYWQKTKFLILSVHVDLKDS